MFDLFQVKMLKSSFFCPPTIGAVNVFRRCVSWDCLLRFALPMACLHLTIDSAILCVAWATFAILRVA